MMNNRVLILIALSASCAGGDGATLDVGDVSDNWSELRARMNVTVTDTATGATYDLTAYQLAQASYSDGQTTLHLVGSECIEETKVMAPCAALAFSPNPDDPTGAVADATCAAMMCETQYRICVAHRLMELADGATSDRTVGTFEVALADQSTQAGLHDVAIDVAREAVIGASNALQGAADASGLCLTSDATYGTGINVLGVGTPGEDQLTVGESLAHAITEGYYLMHDAAMEAFDENLAIADEAFSVEPSATRAARRAYGAPVLSRGAIAHLLLGAPPDMIANSSDELTGALPILDGAPAGSCIAMNDGVRDAIDALREAALPPETILNEGTSVSIDDMISGTLPTTGSLRQRTEVSIDAVGTLPTIADEFYDYIGIVGPAS